MTPGLALDSHSPQARSPRVVLLLSWKLFSLLAQLLWFHSCDASPGRELCCGDRAGLGASARNTETSLPWPGRAHLPPILVNAQERACIILKPTFFRRWTIWWWSSFPPSHLAWLIVICQVRPEGLPDWVIFSENSYKDESFRCAFSMNHTSQAPGPKWSTCPLEAGAVVVRQNLPQVRCDILGAVTF